MEKTPQPGWYPDPEYPGYQRYWNGQQWTDDRATIVPPAGVAEYVRANRLISESKTFNALWFASQVGNAIVFIVFAVAVLALILWISGG